MGFTEIASPLIRQALEDASDPNGFLTMDQFVDIALYHPEFGYYRQTRHRVGRDRSSDFYTATNLADAFAPILVEAACDLLERTQIQPDQAVFVEIGAEPEAALLRNRTHPFQSTRTFRLGQNIALEGPLVVFSNELFDAQPFYSVCFEGNAWRERGVSLSGNGIQLSSRQSISTEIQSYVAQLPDIAPEGYTVDLPVTAVTLLNSICEPPWTGAFIAFDYGKTWKALCYDTPQGTARAYRNHKQVPNLLESLGQQDLTCHICWDWLESALEKRGFDDIALESQESFALKRAPRFIEETFASGPGFSSPAKNQLRQLVHPSLMGQKFQAISGIRT